MSAAQTLVELPILKVHDGLTLLGGNIEKCLFGINNEAIVFWVFTKQTRTVILSLGFCFICEKRSVNPIHH